MKNHRRLSTLTAAALLAFALGGMARAASFSTKCGSAKIPKADRSGVVCVGFCGAAAPIVACTAMDALGQPEPAGAPELDGAAARISIRILGKDVTAGQLANRIGAATGWKVKVPGGFESLRLRAGQWKGAWADLGKMRWKIASSGTIRVTVDEEKRVFSFFVQV